MNVNRCVCTGVTFEDALQLAAESGLGYAQIVQRTECGVECGLCLPYLRVALLLQQPSLPVMTPEEYRKILARFAESTIERQAR